VSPTPPCTGNKPMGVLRNPLPVKLFVGVLTSLPDILPAVENRLSQHFGAIDCRSDLFPFDWTDYYNATMGTPITRCFYGFENLIGASAIAGIKKETNELESLFALEWPQSRRPVNLDPGYIEESKVVLASTKNYYHRILISDSIYAEVTLHFERGAWRLLPWTFPDYTSDSYHAYFTSLRNLYREQLKTRIGT
jgi:hypothetical protein